MLAVGLNFEQATSGRLLLGGDHYFHHSRPLSEIFHIKVPVLNILKHVLVTVVLFTTNAYNLVLSIFNALSISQNVILYGIFPKMSFFFFFFFFGFSGFKIGISDKGLKPGNPMSADHM